MGRAHKTVNASQYGRKRILPPSGRGKWSVKLGQSNGLECESIFFFFFLSFFFGVCTPIDNVPLKTDRDQVSLCVGAYFIYPQRENAQMYATRVTEEAFLPIGFRDAIVFLFVCAQVALLHSLAQLKEQLF